MRAASTRMTMRGTFALAALGALALACTDRSDSVAPDASPPTANLLDAASIEREDSSLATGDLDAGNGADVGSEATHAVNTKHYDRVLLLGDSFVGLGDGLVTGLRPRFEHEGTEVRTVPWKSIKIIYFADDERVPELLKKWNPDLVILVLGSNDMFVNEPEKHAHFVRKTAKLMRGRDCYWLGPPPWKKSTGILDVIARDSAPCTFFDSRGLTIDRNKKDNIHPTNAGGETWAAAFWTFFRGIPGEGATDAGVPVAHASR